MAVAGINVASSHFVAETCSHLYIFLDIKIEKIRFMFFADINGAIWNDDSDPKVTSANTIYYNNGLMMMKMMMMMVMMMMR